MGEKNFTFKKFKDVCAYLLWAQTDKLELKFNVTPETYGYCAAVGDAKLYGVSYGVSELWKLGSYEYLSQLSEFVDIF